MRTLPHDRLREAKLDRRGERRAVVACLTADVRLIGLRSIDDFYGSHLRRDACQIGYEFLIESLERLGWTVNAKKCVPPTQKLVFLGVGITTMYGGEPSIGVFLDAERLARLREQCLGIAQVKGGFVQRSRLRSVVGHLTFCAMVLRDARSFTSVGWALLGDALRNDVHRVFVTKELREELQGWSRRFGERYYSRRLDIKPVHTAFASWDASTTQGMGGYLLGETFAYQWTDFAIDFGGARAVAHYPKFNAMGVPLCTIAMLELFAGFWWIKTFGRRVRGHTVVVHCDNTNVCSMLRKLYGKRVFTPLLIQIRAMLIHFDIDLRVVWISSKANVLSDALSRNDYPGFLRELAVYKKSAGKDADSQNWQLLPPLVASLDAEFGPMQLDGACDVHGANAQFRAYWTAMEDARLMVWDGLRIYINPPFRLFMAILLQFLRCKARCQLGTSAMFIMPVWESADFYKLVCRLPLVFTTVREWPAGTKLFTSPVLPHLGTGRVYRGGAPWPVRAIWAGPLPTPGGLAEFL